MHPDTPYLSPRLFQRANTRLKRSLSTRERRRLAVLKLVLFAEASAASGWEDVHYLAGYGLIRACPN